MSLKEQYIKLLKTYLHKVENDTLDIQEGLNLLDFYVNDVNSYESEKNQAVSLHDVYKYVSLGWYICQSRLRPKI